MKKKTIAIIGGGYGGLSAGIYAQLAGFDTTIFEHNHTPGGLASASFKRGEYRFDDGTHFFMGYRKGKGGIYDLIEPLGLGNPDLFVPMKSFATFIDEASKIKINMDIDLEEVRKDLMDKAPNEKKVIDEFIDSVAKFRDYGKFGLDADVAPDNFGICALIRMFYGLRGVITLMGGENSKTCIEFGDSIKTKWLGNFIKTMFLPDSPKWFLYMVLGVFADDQIAILKNGCMSAINTMIERYKSLGGKIKCNSTVTKIIVENNKVKGIKIEDGTQFESDYVISSGDLSFTLEKLLDGKYMTPQLKERINMKTTYPFFYCTYGVKKEFKDAPYYVNMSLKTPIKYGNHKIETIYMRFLNQGGDFAPKGKSVLQGMYFSEPGYWEDLKAKDPKLYEKEKNRVADEILDKMEQEYPGIKANIEEKDIATPATSIKYTMHKHGCWGGCRICDAVLKGKAKHTIDGLEGFYMTGNWIYSGGICPTLYSSRNCVDLIKNGKKKGMLPLIVIILILAFILKKLFA